MEASLHSKDKDRVHFIWKINIAEALDQTTTAGLEFLGVCPIRRLLDTDFPCIHLYETPAQLRRRFTQVENHMNSQQFAAPGKSGLGDLAKDTRKRCLEVIRLRGERIPK